MQAGNVLRRLVKWLMGDKKRARLTTNEVSTAMTDDYPRIARITLWACVGFFIIMIAWASLAQIDEVTRGDGRAIPSSRLQKIQNLEGALSLRCLSMRER